MEKKTRIRVELVLTESDRDIIDFMINSGLPRATFFKSAIRDYKKLIYGKHDKHRSIEDIIRTTMYEVMSEQKITVSSNEKVKPTINKPNIGFGAKRL